MICWRASPCSRAGPPTHDGQVFAKPGDCYALYFPTAEETGTLDLTDAPGRLVQQWYNPRTGQFAGSREISRRRRQGPDRTAPGGSREGLGRAFEKRIGGADESTRTYRRSSSDRGNRLPVPMYRSTAQPARVRRSMSFPYPSLSKTAQGSFLITPTTPVVAPGAAAPEAAKLMDALAPAMGYRLKPAEDAAVGKGGIQLKIEPSLPARLGAEGYELEATTGCRHDSCCRAGRAVLRRPDAPATAAAGCLQQAEGRWSPVVCALRAHHGLIRVSSGAAC